MLAAGRVIAEGTAQQLKQRLGGKRLEITVARPAQLASEPGSRRASVPVQGGGREIAAAAALAAANVTLEQFTVRHPTLDEVFLSLTGHPADLLGGARAQEGEAA